jgi:hypothetical protein
MEGDPETEGRTCSAWGVCNSECCYMGDRRCCGQRRTGHSVYCGEVAPAQGWLSCLRYQRKQARGSCCNASGLIPTSLPSAGNSEITCHRRSHRYRERMGAAYQPKQPNSKKVRHMAITTILQFTGTFLRSHVTTDRHSCPS